MADEWESETATLSSDMNNNVSEVNIAYTIFIQNI